MLKNYILLILALTYNSVQCQNCDSRPCDYYTITDQIRSLWSLITNLTPNVANYRNTILDGLETSPLSTQQVRLAQSLWAYDAYTDFNFPGIICTYVNLVQKTIDYAKNRATKREMNDAYQNYGQLCQNVIEYATEVSMIPTTCPYNLTTLIDDEPECSIDKNIVVQYLENSAISDEMTRTILALIQSDNRKDRVLGYSSLATFTDKSKDMFKRLFETNELENGVKAKCCRETVPEGCCDYRRQITIHRMKEVGVRLRQVMNLNV